MNTPDTPSPALRQTVEQAHIAELQQQLADAQNLIVRLSKRGGYSLDDMIAHSRKARLDERAQFDASTKAKSALFDEAVNVIALLRGNVDVSTINNCKRESNRWTDLVVTADKFLARARRT